MQRKDYDRCVLGYTESCLREHCRYFDLDTGACAYGEKQRQRRAKRQRTIDMAEGGRPALVRKAHLENGAIIRTGGRL